MKSQEFLVSMLFIFKANSKEIRALKPVYEQTVNILNEKRDQSIGDEKDILDSQLNDLTLRWEVAEEAVHKQGILMEELEPKVKEYHESKNRLAFWLRDAEEKLEVLPRVGDIGSKEFNVEVKVCDYIIWCLH